MDRRNQRTIAIAILLLHNVAGAVAWSQTPGVTAAPSRFEGFEGAHTSWVIVGGDARYQLQVHQRVEGQSRTGRSSEYFRFYTESIGGDRLYIAHDVGHPRIVQSLALSVQVRSNRGGIQLLAEVVLPHAVDPRTRQPITTLIPAASSYSNVGGWERLMLQDLPLALTRRTWGLRMEHGPWVDPRDAYVNRVLINAYGGAGLTELWIDDLDVASYIPAFPESPPAVGPTAPTSPSPAPGGTMAPVTPPIGSGPTTPPVGPPLGTQPSVPAPGGGAGHGASTERSIPGPSAEMLERLRRPVGGGPLPGQRVSLSGNTLLVDGRPILPRIIEYRGESLAFLKQLGFNTIWLAGTPDDRLLREVAREEMWIICPPPQPALATGGSGAAAPVLGSEYDRVLAWNVGRGLDEQHFDDVIRWVRQIRAADSQRARPILCEAHGGLLSYSRQVDILLLGRRPLLSTLALGDYSKWLVAQQRLARPGTPIWTTIQTQPSPALIDQWRAMSADPALGAQAITLDQIRLLLRATLECGTRALFFESDTPLDVDDPATRYRAAVLEMINLELRLLEPWLAGGDVLGQVDGNAPDLRALVLQTERARVMAPYTTDPNARYVVGKSAAERVAFLVPGIPEDYEAYALLPGGPRPLGSSRPAGGTRVVVEACGPASLVLLSQDPLTIHQLTQRARLIGPRVTELRRQILEMEIASTRRVLQQMPGLPKVSPDIQQRYLALAERELQGAETLARSRDYASAFVRLERAAESVRILQHAAWSDVHALVPGALSSPAVASFDSLPAHGGLIRRVQSASYGPNLIGGGDHEDLATWLSSGWNNVQTPVKDVVAMADLAVAASRTGRMGLRVAARLENPAQPVAWVRAAPITIRSPVVPLEAGALVCVHGWVQVPRRIEGTADGLLLIDSIGGEALAERIQQTNGWQEFTMYRFVPRNHEFSLSIQLAGLGEAWLDDISIQRLDATGTMAGTLPGASPSRAAVGSPSRY